MALYLDVKAVRIQSYLTRWPQLRGVRGASALLSREMTATDLPNRGWKANGETGDIDGKLSVIVDDPCLVEEAATEIILELQARLPGAEFEAAWAEAGTYVEAYALMPATSQISVPRTTAHWPASRVCDLCGLDTACEVIDLGFENQVDHRSVCLDCKTRNITRFDAVNRPLVRDAALAKAVGLRESAVPKDFKQLADSGPEGTKTNHLAVVYADANRMGLFFRQAIRDSVDAGDLSRRLTEMTWGALVEATDQLVAEDTKVLPVMPHIIGGDDVLVSLPAAHAWEFTRTFLTVLEEKLASLVDGLEVTVSAGIAIAHASYPFAQTVDIAEQLLGKAKGQFAGETSSVLWLDLTRDGQPLASRPAVALADLNSRAEALGGLAALPKSTRNALERASSEKDVAAMAAQVSRIAKRHGIGSKIAPFRSGPLVLPDALDICRWWR